MCSASNTNNIFAIGLIASLATHSSFGADDIADLAAVVTTATRGSRAASETPQAVSVVTDRMIFERGAATTPDALAGEAGILIQKSNTGGGSPFIRGLTGKQVLLLVDGVRINNSYYRFGPHQYLNTIDPNDISRIEVVHGPSSVLYGSDALGGVINVVSNRGSYSVGSPQNDGLVALRAASADRSVTGRAQFEHSRENFSAVAGVSVKRFGDLRGGDGVGLQIPTAYDEQSGNLRFSYRIRSNQEIAFRQHYLRQKDVPKTNEIILGTKTKFNYEPQINALSYVEYSADKLETGLFDTVKINLSNGRQKEGEEIIERATPTIETRETTSVRTLGLTAQLSKNAAATHRVTYGFDYYHDKFDTRKRRLDLAAGTERAVVPGAPNGATYSTAGFYIQDEIRVNNELQVIPGLRYAHFKAEGVVQTTALKLADNKPTGSLSGVYRLTPNLNLVSSAAQGYRAPNMEDFFGRVDFASEIPNNGLRPETSLNREIGLKYHADRTAASVHYFYSTYKDLIARATVAPGVQQRQNLRKARIEGVEGSINHTFDGGWSSIASFGSARGEDQVTQRPLQRIPPLNGSAYVRYTPTQGTWYEMNAVLARRQNRLSPEDLRDPRIPAGGTPGYAVLNLAVGHQLDLSNEMNLRLENAFNKKYKTHGSGLFSPGTSFVLSYLHRL